MGNPTANRTITRVDIVRTLNKEVGLPLSDCARLLENVLDEITYALAAGEQVKINNFASFKAHQKSERIGRNPKTGEEFPILPRKVVVFRPSQKFRGRLNQQED